MQIVMIKTLRKIKIIKAVKMIQMVKGIIKRNYLQSLREVALMFNISARML